MLKPLNNSIFLERAIKIHGNKYDYSLIEYKNMHTPIKIICPIHGLFKQKPVDHLKGKQCKKCSRVYKPTTKEAIEKLKSIYSDKYDYSLTEYKGNNKKIKIICPKHGVVEMLYNHFLKGKGCKKCNKIYSTEYFIEKAKSIHGDKYDYSLAEYKNSISKIKIICPKHGIFEQSSSNHLSGSGCFACSVISSYNKQKKTTKKDFIEKAKSIHGDKYDYSLTEYNNLKTKLKIICSKHGIFEQMPPVHLRGGGCPACAGRKSSLYLFIEKAKSIHGDKYDYSLVEYKNPTTKIKIVCPKHGVFDITPDNFLNKKNGCKKCEESKGERLIKVYLENIGFKEGVDFETQKTFDECFYKSKLKFDFFFPNFNSVLEFQGVQHFEPIGFFGGEDSFNEQVARDKIKKSFCSKNNIGFYEIQCYDDTTKEIKEIMELIMDKKINSKRKGNTGEKDLCKILNERFGQNKFKRTVFSGAFLGKNNFKRAEGLTEEQQQVFLGDVFANGFNFLIEHKFYAAPISIFDFFNEGSLLNSWIEQVENDAKNSTKKPLLIIKFNNKKRIAFIKEEINIPYVIEYRNWKVLFLDELLKKENSFFFS